MKTIKTNILKVKGADGSWDVPLTLKGSDGADGSDVTSEDISNALGYVPADASNVNVNTNDIADLKTTTTVSPKTNVTCRKCGNVVSVAIAGVSITSTTAVCTLPVGYRPSADFVTYGYCSSGASMSTSNVYHGYILVSTNGNVTFRYIADDHTTKQISGTWYIVTSFSYVQ